MKVFKGARTEVQKLSLENDRVLGYPKPGVNIGGGVHAPPEQSRTVRHAEPRLNRKTGEWMLPVDRDAEVVCDGLAAAKVATVTKADLEDPTDLWDKIGGG